MHCYLGVVQLSTYRLLNLNFTNVVTHRQHIFLLATPTCLFRVFTFRARSKTRARIYRTAKGKTIAEMHLSFSVLFLLTVVSYCVSLYAIMDDIFTEVDRGRIIGMWECGDTNEEIARRIPCSEKTVKKWIERWQAEGKEGLVDRRKYNKGTRTSTEEEDALLLVEANNNPFLSLSQSVHQLDLPFSVHTARRRLHEANIYCYRPARKIPLTDAHRDNRVAFALEQLNTASPEDWERTIWTDEKVFCSSVDQQHFVWRPFDSHRLHPKYVVPRDRSGRITCGMWGWISAHGPGELIEVSPHMDAFEYVDILENVLLPSVRRIYAEEDMPTIRLVQDNSAVHTSHTVQEWFALHPELKVLNWPAKSPDLNLIENVWGKIVNSWNPGYERTRAALIAHAKNAWEDLRREPQFFHNLHNSIHARLQQVVARQGYWTDY